MKTTASKFTAIAAAVWTATLATCAPDHLVHPARRRGLFTTSVQPTPRGHGSYVFSEMTEVQYATALPRTPPTTTYLASASMSAVMPPGVQTTTWAKNVPASDLQDPYGQAQWNARWEPFMPNVSISTFTISTTVQPTPLPSSSLVLPPDTGFTYGDQNVQGLTFPSDFIFGAASSAGQVEGAIQDQGRTPSVLDYFNFNPANEPDYLQDWNYYLYKEDIARMAALGVPYYSFSISWNRILPFAAGGTPVNQEGIDHYNDVINTCLEYGMKPMVTMFHADGPYEFIVDGGNVPVAYFSTNSGAGNVTFVESFVYYAKILFANYGDRVPIWITINEPYYASGNLLGMYNFLEAHTQIYDLYKAIGGKGMVSYKMADNFGVPLNPKNQSDIDAANRYQDFLLGILGNPTWLGVDIPESVSSTCTNESKPLTTEQLARYKGKCDFYAIDPYTAAFITQPPGGIEACAQDPSNPLWPSCVVQSPISENNWEIGFYSNDYPYMTPDYFRSFMNYLWETYSPQAIMVTEFGFPVFEEALAPLASQANDLPRTLYYNSYLTEILNCIHEDGINIIGAIGWSMLDNWEFGTYAQHFGMQNVNRTTFERTYKRSFFDFVGFFHSHGL
jgi:beta-glucosidase/6-phospho-beta-glucosidase/beta-galactosidase